MDKDPGSPFVLDPSPGIPSEQSEVTELVKPKLGHTSSSPFNTCKKGRVSTTVITTKPGEFRWKVMVFTGGFFPFVSLCSLFPPDYEFAKQELVSLLVAQRPFRFSTSQEEDGAFDSLVSSEVVVPSRFDPSTTVDFFHQKTRRLLYKINHSKIRLSKLEYAGVLDGNLEEYARVLDGNLDDVPHNVKHLSIDSKSIEGHVGFESMKRFQLLQTLLVIPAPGFYVEQVLRDLFLSLKHLRSLSFSRSLMSELPSSIGNLKSLRYLDLSYTPIKRLPNSIASLHNLQTLRLRGRVELVGLPKGTGKLTSLRHLDLDIIGQLKSMLLGMGNSTDLRPLSTFLVGKDDGCQIVELKNMVNLTGAFCISRIENVMSFEEALEADLISKKFLRSLQLSWTETREHDATKEEQILQCLRPPLGLKRVNNSKLWWF